MNRVLSLALLAAGCSTSATGGAPGSNLAAESTAAIVGPQFVACTTDANGTACQFTPPAGYPIAIEPVISISSSTGVQTADLSDGAVHTINGGANATLLVIAQLSSGIAGLVDGNTNYLSMSTMAAGVQTFSVPYDIWPIHLSGAGSMTVLSATPVPITIAPWVTFAGASTTTASPMLPQKAAGADVDTAVLVAHDTTSIGGTALFCPGDANINGSCTTLSYALTGPGAYDVSPTGLAAGASSPNAPDLGGTTPISTPTTTPDMGGAAPASPPATCGSANAAACVDSYGNAVCTAGNVLDATSNTCHACGGDSEPACLDSYGNHVCNSGNVIDSSNTCHACGNDSEPACLDSYGNHVCNSGNVIDGSNACHVCGDTGELACHDSYNNPVCNAGLAVDGNGLCN